MIINWKYLKHPETLILIDQFQYRPEYITINADYSVLNTKERDRCPANSLAEYLSTSILKHEGVKKALIDYRTKQELSYAELHYDSMKFANVLKKLGFTKSDLVLFFGDNSIEYAVCMLGVIFLGSVYCPVTPANGPFELSEQVNDSKSSLLIIDSEKLTVLESALANETYRDKIKKNLKLIIVINSGGRDHDDTSISKLRIALNDDGVSSYKDIMKTDVENKSIDKFDVNLDDKLIVVYTSGTTGLPKGAIHSNRSVLSSLVFFDNPFKHHEFAFWFPFGHISGSMVIFANLIQGLTNTLFKEAKLDDILELVASKKIPYVWISPEHASMMSKRDYTQSYDLSGLKTICCGGSKIPPNQSESIRQRYGVNFYECYGCTEFMFGVSNEDIIRGIWKPGDVGRPTPGIELKIKDVNSDRSLPAYERGEICLRGPLRLVGYLNNKQATDATIDKDGWFHSGDVGYYDETGALFIVDRIKELLKFRAWSVSPNEIEDFLLRQTDVEEVCVIGVKHSLDVNHLRAYIKLRNGSQMTKQELIELVNDDSTKSFVWKKSRDDDDHHGMMG
ncbi:hypothetical protein NH340_JMT01152 [Sarcoptes scabiei]|nr:hypothetical protein NH340_JMT01152 [Sarcoptes scabiei]